MRFEDWLDEEKAEAQREALETHKTAMNSYGAGYAAGYAAALKVVVEKITPEIGNAEV